MTTTTAAARTDALAELLATRAAQASEAGYWHEIATGAHECPDVDEDEPVECPCADWGRTDALMAAHTAALLAGAAATEMLALTTRWAAIDAA